jgi:hypothetical protein
VRRGFLRYWRASFSASFLIPRPIYPAISPGIGFKVLFLLLEFGKKAADLFILLVYEVGLDKYCPTPKNIQASLLALRLFVNR